MRSPSISLCLSCHDMGMLFGSRCGVGKHRYLKTEIRFIPKHFRKQPSWLVQSTFNVSRITYRLRTKHAINADPHSASCSSSTAWAAIFFRSSSLVASGLGTSAGWAFSGFFGGFGCLGLGSVLFFFCGGPSAS